MAATTYSDEPTGVTFSASATGDSGSLRFVDRTHGVIVIPMNLRQAKAMADAWKDNKDSPDENA
jgi:hypothetical protein